MSHRIRKALRDGGLAPATARLSCSTSTLVFAGRALVCAGGVLVCSAASCGGARSDVHPPTVGSPKAAPGAAGSLGAATAASPSLPSAQAAAKAQPTGSVLTDQAPVAFRADFSASEPGDPWNVFGAKTNNRTVRGGPDGLWLTIDDAERAWDAVGMRTARLEVDGDFDLRASFRDFTGQGDVSAKLIVVDARRPRGEAAYVERIHIDDKALFKFGGEVEGSLENWGFLPTDATAGDLRLVRKAGELCAYARADKQAAWTAVGPPQPVPSSMPRVLKFGVKLSAGPHRSAKVRWQELTLDGKLLRL